MKSIRSFKKTATVAATLVAFSGSTMLMTGCKTAMLVGAIAGAGTVAAVIVIAKYKASEQQKALAEEQARGILARAAKPHYERRRAEKQAAAQKKVADIEREYRGRGAQEAEKKQALVKAQADSAAELADLDREWQSLAGGGGGLKMDAAKPAAGGVQFASTGDREALAASAAAHLPKFIAVSVPTQGIAEEKGGKGTIMLWDTLHQRLVTDDVYVLKRGVRPGTTVKVDGVKALVASTQ